MNIQKLLFFALLLSFTACSAQKNKGKTMDFIEIVKAQKGNTGFRGRVPKEDMNKPNQGKDFYILEIKAVKDCYIQLVNLAVDKNKQTIFLSIANDEGRDEFLLKKGDHIFLRAEVGETNITVKNINTALNCLARLCVKINQKQEMLDIQKIEEILPN
jgi:hypothetical protein